MQVFLLVIITYLTKMEKTELCKPARRRRVERKSDKNKHSLFGKGFGVMVNSVTLSVCIASCLVFVLGGADCRTSSNEL